MNKEQLINIIKNNNNYSGVIEYVDEDNYIITLLFLFGELYVVGRMGKKVKDIKDEVNIFRKKAQKLLIDIGYSFLYLNGVEVAVSVDIIKLKAKVEY